MPYHMRAGANPHEYDEPPPEPDEEDRTDEVRQHQREDEETPEVRLICGVDRCSEPTPMGQTTRCVSHPFDADTVE